MPTSERERQELFDKKVAVAEEKLVAAERALHDLRTFVETFGQLIQDRPIEFAIKRRRRWLW